MAATHSTKRRRARRGLLRALGAAALAPAAWALAPCPALAQGPGAARRIGFLGGPQPQYLAAFRDGMRALGFVEGKNLVIEFREVSGSADDAARRGLAAELVALNVEVIVASVTRNALAARDATARIPIVMVNAGDPVEVGLTSSLDRPTGNITGLSRNSIELVRADLALLLEVVPAARRIGVLANPANPLHPRMIFAVRRDIRERGLGRHVVNLTAPEEIPAALESMSHEGVDALIVLTDTMFYQSRAQLAQIALERKLPVVYQNAEHVEAGGLMAYAPDQVERYRLAASYVERLLKGAKPAELPIQLPAKFDLAVNLRTARALGLTIPPAVIARANRVIE